MDHREQHERSVREHRLSMAAHRFRREARRGRDFLQGSPRLSHEDGEDAQVDRGYRGLSGGRPGERRRDRERGLSESLHQLGWRSRVRRRGIRMGVEGSVDIEPGPHDGIRPEGDIDRRLGLGHVPVDEDPRMPTEDLWDREEPGTGHDSFRDKRLDPPLDRVPRQAQGPSDAFVRSERIAGEAGKDLEVLLVDHGSRRFIKRAIFEIVRPDAR